MRTRYLNAPMLKTHVKKVPRLVRRNIANVAFRDHGGRSLEVGVRDVVRRPLGCRVVTKGKRRLCNTRVCCRRVVGLCRN